MHPISEPSPRVDLYSLPTCLRCSPVLKPLSDQPDISIVRIRTTHTEDEVTANQELFHVLVMNVRGPALAVIRAIADMSGALAWRAWVTRYAPDTAQRVQSLMSAILNAKSFPEGLQPARSHWMHMAREHPKMGSDFWRPLQRVNEENSLPRQSTR